VGEGTVVKVARGIGWLLVVSGAVVLLYVVYLLWFTNLETGRAQSDLAETWSMSVPGSVGSGEPQAAASEDGPDAGAGDGDGASDGDPDAPGTDAVQPGEAYAAVWFERDGQRIVNDEVLYVVEGVTLEHLKSGPGHYPGSDRPGGEGNLAIAGHRTTYGAPFWSLDELTDGDTIHVVDLEGREWVYAYREQRVVTPQDVWVVGPDPLETGEPTITLTTCHPRGSARERLIAWGELVDDPIASTADDAGGVSELPET
jgi:sortase A